VETAVTPHASLCAVKPKLVVACLVEAACAEGIVLAELVHVKLLPSRFLGMTIRVGTDGLRLAYFGPTNRIVPELLAIAADTEAKQRLAEVLF
jgi:hypothetical protein